MASTPDRPPVTVRLAAWSGRRTPELFAALLAVAWFSHLGYGATLRPTHITWMLRYDWPAPLFGFSFFRNADWSLPLGNTPNLFHPFGTSVAFSDACPWVALPFKLLSPVLPLDFQYFGAWFLLCYVLQAVVGVQIARVFSPDRVQQALGGALFALTPLLPARHAHIALCALFFVTSGVYLHLRPLSDRADAVRVSGAACGLLALAAGTHAYLSVMLLALVLALFLRIALVERLFDLSALAIAVLAALATTALVYLLFGYVGWKETALAAEGFGAFSADLLTLVNPQEWSRFVAPLPYHPRQWEGFGYLGLGVLALLVVRIALCVARPRATLRWLLRAWPLLVVLAGLAFYALSSRVTRRGELVLDLEPLYRHASRLTGIFRSSGRFVWPLHVALIAAAVSCVGALRPWLGRVLLLGALAVQAVELNPAPLIFDPVPLHPLAHPAWATAGEHYRHLRLVPIHLLWICRYDPALVHRLSYEAYRRRLTFNSGNFGRTPPGIGALCERGLEPGSPLDAATIYVIDPAFRPQLIERGAVCGLIDGLATCVSPDNPTPLLAALREGQG